MCAVPSLAEVKESVSSIRDKCEVFLHDAACVAQVLPVLLLLLDAPSEEIAAPQTTAQDDTSTGENTNTHTTEGTADAAVPTKQPVRMLTSGRGGGCVPASMDAAAEESSLRNTALEVLLRIPVSEANRHECEHMLTAARGVLNVDNEVNGALAVRLISQVHKALRGGMEAEALAALRIFLDSTRSLDMIVTHVLNNGYDASAVASKVAAVMAGAPPGTHLHESMVLVLQQLEASNNSTNIATSTTANATAAAELRACVAEKRSLPARYSFKVLLEAAGAIVTFATTYATPSSAHSETLTACIDAMLKSIQHMSMRDIVSLARGHVPSLASCPNLVKYVRHRQWAGEDSEAARLAATRNGEFVALQAKYLWWAVTYARLAGLNAVRRYDTYMATGIVRLLAICSPEAPSIRRDILSSVRTFVSSELRTAFFPDIGLYLDARILTGPLGAASHEGIKASAYSVLADLVYHARDLLDLTTLATVTDVFSTVITDFTLSASVHTIAIRLLFQIITTVYQLGIKGRFENDKDPSKARALLVQITACHVARLKSLSKTVDRVLMAERRSLADQTRERQLYDKQLSRVAAAAEVATLSLPDNPKRNLAYAAPISAHLSKEKLQGRNAALPTHEVPLRTPADCAQIATALQSGLAHANVSPWVIDEYTEFVTEQISGGAPTSSVASATTSSSAATVGSSAVPGASSHHPAESIRDVRTLVRALVQGMRSVVWCLTNYKRDEADKVARESATNGDVILPPDPALAVDGGAHMTVETIDRMGANGLGGYSHGTTLSEHELKLLLKYTRYGLRCLDVFVLSPSSTATENNEICEAFPFLFQYCDKHQIRDIFAKVLPELLSRVFSNPALMAVPQGLLVQKETCRPIADCILATLTRHVHLLNVSEYCSIEDWKIGRVGESHGRAALSGAYTPQLLPRAKQPREVKQRNRKGHNAKHISRALTMPGVNWTFNADGEFDGVLPAALRGKAQGNDLGIFDMDRQPEQRHDKTLIRMAQLAAGIDVDALLDSDCSDCESEDSYVTNPDEGLLAQQELVSSSPNTPATTPAQTSAHANVRATQFLRLFKVVLMSLAEIPPDSNNGYTIDPILTLRPFIAPIVRSTLRNALASKHPFHHLYLLRTLFRQVSQATRRTDPRDSVVLLYAEFQPLIAPILDTCFRIHASTSDQTLRDSALEICLSMPLRLSMTLPHLPKMLTAITLGLRIIDERKHLPALSLTMFDYWVENLTPSFLYSVMAYTPNMLQELMSALTSLIKPHPAQYGVDAIRLLGKLGGMNRLYLALPPRLGYVSGNTPHQFPASAGSVTGESPNNSGFMFHMNWRQPRRVYTPPASILEHDQAAADSVLEGKAEGDFQAPSLEQDTVVVPIEKILHFAHQALLRYFQPMDEASSKYVEMCLQDADLPVTPKCHKAVVRNTSRRYTPNSAAGVGDAAEIFCTPTGVEHASKAALANVAGDEWRKPLKRYLRQPDTGEYVYVTATQALRMPPAEGTNPVGSLSTSDSNAPGRNAGRHRKLKAVYDSDSDSGAENDANIVREEAFGTFAVQPSPWAAMMAATRGPLAAKRSAWKLLCTLIPQIIDQIPVLAECETWFRDWVRHGAVVHPKRADRVVPVALHHQNMEENAQTCFEPAQTSKLFSARKILMELLHGLGVAAADSHLQAVATPLFLTVLQRLTMLSIMQSSHALGAYASKLETDGLIDIVDPTLIHATLCSLLCDDAGAAQAAHLRSTVALAFQRGLLMPMLQACAAQTRMLDMESLLPAAVNGVGHSIVQSLAHYIGRVARRPTTLAKIGACRLILLATSVFGPGFLRMESLQLTKGVLHVLDTFHPDSAAETALLATTASALLVDAVLQSACSQLGTVARAPLGIGLHEHLHPMQENADIVALLQLVEALSRGLTSSRCACREECMMQLCNIASAIFAKVAPASVDLPPSEYKLLILRGVASLLAPHVVSIVDAVFKSDVHLHLLSREDMISTLFAFAALLQFSMDAVGPRASHALSPYDSWKALVSALGNEHLKILARLQDALALTTSKAFDPNIPAHTPEAISAASTMNALFAMQVGAEVTSKTGVQSIGGQHGGPITVAGAVAASADTASVPMTPVSSSLNPSHEAHPTVMEESACLFAAQATPYPLRLSDGFDSMSISGSSVQDLGINAGWLEHPVLISSPRFCERVSDGKFVVAHALGVAGARALQKGFLAQAVEKGQDGWIIEVLPRGYDPQIEYRPLPFAVLLRLATLRFMEACARSVPQCFANAPSEGEPGSQHLGPAFRARCFSIMFECVPSLHAEKEAASKLVGGLPADLDINSGLLVTDRVPPVSAPATGHSKQIMTAVQEAISAFHLKPEGERMSLLHISSSGSVVEAMGGAGTLPRDLLHAPLRPMLSYFQDCKKINNEILDALGALLTRISYCFNTALADKLIKDIANWVNPEAIRSKLGNTGREPEIAASLMNLFQLLPLDSKQFTPKFVRAVCILDAKMHLFRSRGILTTPFRKSFSRYMSRYPSDVAEFFFTDHRLLNPAHGNLFDGAIRAVSLTAPIHKPDAANPFAGKILESSGFLQWIKEPVGWIYAVRHLAPDVYLQLKPDGEPVPTYSRTELNVLHHYFARMVGVIAKYWPDWLLVSHGMPQYKEFDPLRVMWLLWNSPYIQQRLRDAPATIPVQVEVGSDAPEDEDSLWNGYSPVEPAADAPAHSHMKLREPQLCWRQPSVLRATMLADVRALVSIWLGTCKSFLRQPATYGRHASSVVEIILTLLSVMAPFSRLDAQEVRHFFRNEVSTCPSWSFRNALLLRSLELVQQPKPVRSTGVTPIMVVASLPEYMKVLVLRHLVHPVVKHAFIAEEAVARLLTDGMKEDALVLYRKAGGVDNMPDDGTVFEGPDGSAWFFSEADALDSSVANIAEISAIDADGDDILQANAPYSASRVAGALDKSRLAITTPTSVRTLARTPSSSRRSHAFGGTGGVQLDLQGPALLSAATKRQAPRTPGLNTSISSVSSTSSLPVPASMSWTAATYYYGGKTKVVQEAAAKAEVESDSRSVESLGTLSKATFAPRYPFPRLLSRSVITSYLSIIARDRGDSDIASGAALATETARRRNLNDDLLIELLRLADIFLAQAGFELHPERKKIVVFAWSFVRNPESLLQAWAYRVVCRSTQVYLSPFDMQTALLNHIPKIVAKPEGRDVYRKALNLLLPTLPLRLSEQDWMKCARYVRKFIADELYYLPNATFVWALIVDHARLFYPMRSSLYPLVTVTLKRLLLAPSAPSPAQRQLALELLTVCANWQAQSRLEHVMINASTAKLSPGELVAEPAAGEHREARLPQYPTPPAGYGAFTMDGSAVAPNPDGLTGSRVDDDFAELLVGLAAKLVLMSCEMTELRQITRRSISLFATLVRLYPDVSLHSSSFERPPQFIAAQQQAAAAYAKAVKDHAAASASGAASKPPPAKPNDTSPLYYSTLLELLLITLAAEGRACDFAAEHAGFVILNLTPVFASSDRRALTLLRRFFRRLLQLYPHSHPSQRMVHVRLYPWMGSCISMRLSLFQGQPPESQTNYARVVSDQNEPIPEVKNKTREETASLKLVVDCAIRPPVISPKDPPLIGSEKYRPEDIARATQVVNRAFPHYTYERAKLHCENDKYDDKMARDGWQLVKELGAASGAENARFPAPTEANIMGLIRLVRDVSRLAHNFVHPLAILLFGIFTRFFDDHLSADAAASSQENMPSLAVAGPMGAYQTDGSSPNAFELRQMRASMLAILIPLLSHRSIFIAGQRGAFILCVMKLLQRSNDKGIVRAAMKQVVQWMVAPPHCKSSITYGLSQREKLNFLSAMSAFGIGQFGLLATPNTQRQTQLGEVYFLLQDSYLQLLLQLYTGNSKVTESMNTAIVHTLQLSKLLHNRDAAVAERSALLQTAAQRPPGWLVSFLRRTVLTGLVSGNISMRNACFNLFVADARERRCRELREEVDRYKIATEVHTARLRSKKARRAALWASELGLGDAAVAGALYPLPGQTRETSKTSLGNSADYGAALEQIGGTGVADDLIVPSVDQLNAIATSLTAMTATGGEKHAIGSALNHAGFEDVARVHTSANPFAQSYGTYTVKSLGEANGPIEQPRYSLYFGDEQDPCWHTNLDATTASSLYSAYLAVSTVAPNDNRARLAAFAGIEDAQHGGPLSAIQDIITCDWEPVAGYMWLPLAVNLLLQQVHEAQSPSADASFSLLTSMQDACMFSVDMANELWQSLFPQAWSAIDEEARVRLTPHMQNLVVRELFQHQVANGSATANLEMVAGGAVVKERDRDVGFGAAACNADFAWSHNAIPVSILEAAAGLPTLSTSKGLLSIVSDEYLSCSSFGGAGGAAFHPVASSHVDLATTNVLSLLMNGLRLCKPSIYFPPEVLAFVARSAATHDVVVPLLERALEVAVAAAENAMSGLKSTVKSLHEKLNQSTDETKLMSPGLLLTLTDAAEGDELGEARSRLTATKTHAAETVQALLNVYQSLHAEDLVRGVRRRFCPTLTSARGLDMEAHGLWSEAQETYHVAFQHTKEAADFHDFTHNLFISQQASAAKQAAAREDALVEDSVSAVAGGKQLNVSADDVLAACSAQHRQRGPKRQKRHHEQIGCAAELPPQKKAPADHVRAMVNGICNAMTAQPSASRRQLLEGIATLRGLARNDVQMFDTTAMHPIITGRLVALPPSLDTKSADGVAAQSAPMAIVSRNSEGDASLITLAPEALPATQMKPATTLAISEAFVPSQGEIELWEERWVETARNLCQWQVAQLYAKSVGDTLLDAEACSKVGDWGRLKELCRQPQVMMDASRNAQSKLYEVECALTDGNFTAASTACDAATTVLLRNWQILPRFGTFAHEALLATSQRVLEVRESIAQLVTVKQIVKATSAEAPDLRSLLSAWRERQPNRWDGLPIWDSINTWRHHFFSAITQTLGDKFPKVAPVHDISWTVIRLAHVARKLNLKDVCSVMLHTLDKLPTMDVTDAFAKTREQLLVNLPDKYNIAYAWLLARKNIYNREIAVMDGNVKHPETGELNLALSTAAQAVHSQPSIIAAARGGLVTLHRLDLNVFPATETRAEVWRMKGVHHEVLGAPHWGAAYACYSYACQGNKTSGKCWLSWANFLERLYGYVRVEARIPESISHHDNLASQIQPLPFAAEPPTRANAVLASADVVANSLNATAGHSDTNAPLAPTAVVGQESPVAPSSRSAQLAVQCICAYLTATALRCNMPTLQLSRVLYVMLQEEGSPVVSAAAQQYADTVPVWLWLPYLPQLLTYIGRGESTFAQRIVRALLAAYPQASFYAVRAALLERRDNLNTVNAAVNAVGEIPDSAVAEAFTAMQSGVPVTLTQERLTASTSRVVRQSHDVLQELVVAARKANPAVVLMDSFCDEVAGRLRGGPFEDTLNTLMSFYGKCQQVVATTAIAVVGDVVRGVPAAEAQAKAMNKVSEYLPQVLSTIQKYMGYRVLPKPSSVMSAASQASSQRFISKFIDAFSVDFLPKVSSHILRRVKELPTTGESTTVAGRKRKRNEISEDDATEQSGTGAETEEVNPFAPTSLTQLLARFRCWKSKLLQEASEATSLDTHELVPGLLTMFTGGHISAMEVPGQYATLAADTEPFPARHARIVTVAPTAPLVANTSVPGAVSRRIGFIADDGKRYYFTAGICPYPLMNTDTRVVQLMNMMNLLMNKHPDARSRRLQFTAQGFVAISHKQRLVQDSPSLVSLHTLLDQHLSSRTGTITSADDLITLFRTKLVDHSTAGLQVGEEPQAAQQRLMVTAFRDVCEALPATTLTNMLAASMTSPEALSAVRARFIGQYAVANALGLHLGVIDRTPARLFVDRSSGNFISTEFRPTFSGHSFAMLGDAAEPVPMRLTRNITTFFTPQGMLGPFAASFCAHHRVQFNNSEALTAYIGMLLWDECHDQIYQRLMAYAGKATESGKPSTQPTASSKPSSFVAMPGIPARVVYRRIMHNQIRWFDRATELQSPTISSKIVSQNMQGPALAADMLSPRGHVLIEQSMQDSKLVRMPYQWHPWY